eukprot:5047984-Amphidinium_carterae.1
MKMTLLIQNIRGDIKSRLLLTTDLAKAYFEDLATKVEDYYRNVYIDSNNGGQVAALQKPQKPWKPWKPGKGKGKDKAKDHGKGKGGKDYPQQPWKGYGKGKGGKYGKQPYYNKGKQKERVVSTTTNDRKATTTEKKKTKATVENHKVRHYRPTTTGAKEREEEKAKEANALTLCVTTVENGDTRSTSVGGKDKFTTSIKHNRFGQYRMATQLSHYNKYHNLQHLR